MAGYESERVRREENEEVRHRVAHGARAGDRLSRWAWGGEHWRPRGWERAWAQELQREGSCDARCP